MASGVICFFFFFQAEDGIRDLTVTGVQTCALPISLDFFMRILQFAPRICWPLDTGAKLRNYHLARGLSEHGPVTLLAFTDHEQAIVDLAKIYEQVITIPRDRGYTTAKILQGGLGRT